MGWVRCGLGIPSSVLSLPTPSEASGVIARFNTDLTENLLSAVAEFSASQASGTPTPSAPIPIVGVNKVAIYNGGKNLIDLSSMVSGYVTTTGTFSSAHSMGEMRSNFIPVKPNTTYTFAIKQTSSSYDSWCGIGLYKDNDINSYILRRTNLWTFTTTEDTRFIVVSARNIADASQIQLEQGSPTTEYEPYNGTTVIINLGGTYYGGYIDVVTGKITLTHKKVVFDENIPLSDFGIEAITGYARISYIPIQSDGKGNTEFISDTLHFVQPSATKNVYDIWNTTTVPRMFIALPDTITTKQEAVAWFEDNPTEVVYELATPIVVYASNTAEIPTIVGDNQVYADTGDVEAEYLETVGHKIS